MEAEGKPAHTVVLATTQVGIIKLTSFMPVISQFLQFNSVYLSEKRNSKTLISGYRCGVASQNSGDRVPKVRSLQYDCLEEGLSHE